MSNEIQKQYKAYEDVWSKIQCMKEHFGVPDRYIRYTVTKEFFGVMMMLSLVEKLKDLQADFVKEETYIDVILQSRAPSFDQFIINYKMNGFDKSLPKLINMLVQYETRIQKSLSPILVGEALKGIAWIGRITRKRKR
ncbi:UNVERIFIED_CONTAM: hypothetical protein Sangu_2523500 [Sesamum angustifolium]|uniref:Uncharacterized protein n=1 Tax=Sesamum angustifolium TaxID=2727405 RepID=A0AAW2JH68_9LAMI